MKELMSSTTKNLVKIGACCLLLVQEKCLGFQNSANKAVIICSVY